MQLRPKIRPCEIGDYPALTSFDEFIGDRRIDMQHGTLMVAEFQGEVVGYAKVAPSEFFGWPLLSILCVATSVRRRGIGRALIAAIAADPRWLRIYTSTEASNAAMRALLRKQGAHEVGFADGLNMSEEREILFRLK